MKKYLRFFCSFFCSLILISSQALASPATSSEWATPSEFPIQHIQNAANSIAPPLANNVTEVENTVDLTDVQASVWFHGKDGTNFSKSVYLDSDGSFVIPDFQSDVGIDYAFRIEFYLRSGALPPAGKYTMSFSFSSDTGGWTYTNGVFYSNQANDNVAVVNNTVEFPIFSQFSGGANGQLTVDFGRVTNASIQLNLPQNSNNGFSLPIGGKFSLRFVKLSSSADTDAVTAGGAQTTDDIQTGISNSVNVISSSVDEITDQIAELIQVIINQLDALWNQFAGEFTNMFSAWQTHTDAIVAAIQNITVTASDGIQNIIDAGHDDADQIQENQDQNTDTIVNGYDNSSMTQENDRLNDSLSQLEDAEDQLFDDAKNYINDFEFENPFTQFTAPLSDLSYWLVGIYDGLGSMNIPISFGFTLSIALLLIGWYRFKGGV